MKSENDQSSSTGTFDSPYEGILDFEVQDNGGTKVGHVDHVYIDDTGDPAFLGVKTGWLFGKSHVVPAQRVELKRRGKVVKLPYSKEQIKDAPSLDDTNDISPADQDRVLQYYGLDRSTSGVARSANLTASDDDDSSNDDDSSAAVGERDDSSDASSTRNDSITDRDDDTNAESRTIRLKEEEVKVGKRTVEAGGVRLRKVIRTETVNQPVELAREEIVIERVPSSERSTSDENFSEEEIFIPLRREEAVVQKEAHVREEVRVGKKKEIDRDQVSAEVRREDLEVERNVTPDARDTRDTETSQRRNR